MKFEMELGSGFSSNQHIQSVFAKLFALYRFYIPQGPSYPFIADTKSLIAGTDIFCLPHGSDELNVK